MPDQALATGDRRVKAAAKWLMDDDSVYEDHPDLAERAARGILEAADDSTPSLVVVPREPTTAMLMAARDWSAARYGKPIGDDAARGCWAAMLGAVNHD